MNEEEKVLKQQLGNKKSMEIMRKKAEEGDEDF